MTGTLNRRAADAVDSRLWHHLALGVHPACAIAAYKDGELALDLYGGDLDPAVGSKVKADTLFSIWSCGKPLAAACLWVLKDRGKFDWDDRVADVWPGYGKNGKEATTIRQVLTHRAGIPTTPRAIEEFYATGSPDWAVVVEALEGAEAEFEPGSAIKYHSGTFGYLVAEITQRISGKPFEEFFQSEVAGPLGLADTTFTLDESQMDRLARLKVMPGFDQPELAERGNAAWYKANPSPGGNGTSTARDLARFYSVLTNGGAVDGNQWISAGVVSDVTACHAEGIELASGHQTRWGLGLQLSVGAPNRYGDDPGPDVFGHGGVGTCISWGDPALKAGVAVLTTGMQPADVNVTRLQTFSQLVRDALTA